MQLNSVRVAAMMFAIGLLTACQTPTQRVVSHENDLAVAEAGSEGSRRCRRGRRLQRQIYDDPAWDCNAWGPWSGEFGAGPGW